MGLIVALDNAARAQGDLYLDDGVSEGSSQFITTGYFYTVKCGFVSVLHCAYSFIFPLVTFTLSKAALCPFYIANIVLYSHWLLLHCEMRLCVRFTLRI